MSFISRLLGRDTDQLDHMTELERDARCLPDRKGVPDQILAMIRFYGLTARDLSEPPWLAAWVVENCDGCTLAGHCFKTPDGKNASYPHIHLEKCPNAEYFEKMAKDLDRHGKIERWR